MKLLKKLSQWITALPAFKFLFLLALFLLANAIIGQQFLNYQQSSTSSAQTNQLIDFIITSGNQQITPLVEHNQLEQIPTQLAKLVEYDLLDHVSLYQQDGSLLSQSAANTDTNNHLAKVSNIETGSSNSSYLVFKFNKLQLNPSQSNFWLYYPALGLWLLACLLFLFKPKEKSSSANFLIKETPIISYKKELQQLLKRSQSQATAKNLLIINADWEAYNNKPRQPLISLLNKWTAHHKCHLVSFEKDLMILGLPNTVELELLKKVQILETCLKELGINSTLLIHSLNFGEAVYQHFFGIVEQGLWLESKEELGIVQNAIRIKKDIEIEVESYGLLHLLLIDALTAEDATYIERQSRFFLQ